MDNDEFWKFENLLQTVNVLENFSDKKGGLMNFLRASCVIAILSFGVFGIVFAGVYGSLAQYSDKKVGTCIITNYTYFYYNCPGLPCQNCIDPINDCLNFTVNVMIKNVTNQGFLPVQSPRRRNSGHDAAYFIQMYPLNKSASCMYNSISYEVWFDYSLPEPFFITMLVFFALCGVSVLVLLTNEVRLCCASKKESVTVI